MDLTMLVRQHAQGIAAVRDALAKTIAASRKDMDLSRRELHHIAELLVDEALLFRFYKKHKYDHAATHAALLSHIDWRLQNDLPNLSLSSLPPSALQYLQKGLFYFLRTDKLGRPVAVLNLRHFSKHGHGDFEDLRWFFILAMEVARRVVQSINEEVRKRRELGILDEASDRIIAQISIIVDLEGVGLNNVKYDMIPLFHDLFSHHYPQTVGTVYVLNYGWIHSGIWSVLKTALPADATKKLMFLTTGELTAHISPENLPTCLGGYEATPYSLTTCPVYTNFCHPNYHSTSPRISHQISLMDAEDEGYHEDEDIWYDAVEAPMTPCRSAADLQNLLRVSSGRNLHGMNRVGSTKSLKTLAAQAAVSGSGYTSLRSSNAGGGLVMRPFNRPDHAIPLAASQQPPRRRRRTLIKSTLLKTPATLYSFLSSTKLRYMCLCVLALTLVGARNTERIKRLYWKLVLAGKTKRDVGFLEAPAVVVAVGGALRC
ncbi:uncharacterized protein SPPG_05333 [Spizellomyces punctatus DAOM BR117]|uniref:CRAL-TRIO domain-containing protein n=1 Tax=Spizellomyces punctatus (strain DAOM BR117) TaxID=645134 RepID=A0A0L0HG05_SPIPD|nr:uncharacterized protein SPPG_05333 [Spizellomyces punctatus DAOM BR117]KNC99961.1 hypothetical protein SPPG_05333 [Spizellomyces punctatus DAOM BR117]|eukprot:XP_016608001.1 hypothetical protein SPPG_05333 [Spizellomyces punctatus DAOM BR117]